MWNKGVVLTTVLGAFLIITGFMIMGFDIGRPNLPGWEKIAIVVTTLLLLALITFVIFIYPMKIIMWEDSFIVRRVCGNKVIGHENIKYIHRIKKHELEGSGKFLGNGNLGGYWGTFHTVEHGKCRIYSRNLRNMLFLEMDDGRKYVISYTPKSEQEREALKNLMER